MGKVNLTKELKVMYSGNYNTSVKEIGDTNKWKDTPCL